MTTKSSTRGKNIHIQCSLAVDMIMKTALARRTMDNVTCVMVAFKGFERIFTPIDVPLEKPKKNNNISEEKSPFPLAKNITKPAFYDTIKNEKKEITKKERNSLESMISNKKKE